MDTYYKKRATEYEKIYQRDDPIRQKELKKIGTKIKRIFKDKDVLEVAAGTGYWTQILSQTASNIVATDIVPEVIKLAKTKQYKCQVKFQIKDAYNLSFKKHSFNGGLANFWFSHIPKEKISEFLIGFHRVLKSGSSVFMADNVYNPDLGGTLSKKAHDENTYRIRTLEDGSKYEVLKNYYAIEDLISEFKKYIPNFAKKNIFYGKCFWYLRYQISS